MGNVYGVGVIYPKGTASTIYKCFAHWSNLGIFEKIFEQPCAESDVAELSIDSTYVKALAAGAKKGFNCNRKKRGGKTSKIHNACEVLNGFNLQDKTIMVDRGYSSFHIKNFI